MKDGGRGLIPYTALVLLPLILLAPIVFGGRVLYWGTPLMQFYPWQHFAAETWRMGEAPLWNPLLGNGALLAANLQAGAFYPLNALYLILPTEIAMGYTATIHVILTGWFMFAFGRAIGLQPLPALIAAIAFQLNGFFISRLGFLSITVTLPWLAAWLWRAERALQSHRLRDALTLALVIGLGLLAGHAQTALYGLIMLAAYVVYRSIRAGGRGLVLIAAGVALGIALAAIQLVPAVELARESQRAGGLDYTFAMTHSYWPWRLLTLFAPDLFGNPAYGTFWGYDNYWENAAYIGLIPLALAFVAARSKLKLPTPFFTLCALLSLVLAFGWFTPIYPFLFRAVPGFDLFQGPARWLCVFSLAMCTLAGIGAESLLETRGDLRRNAKWIIAGLALMGGGLAARGFLAGRAATFPDPTLRLGALLAAGALLMALRPSIADRRFRIWSIALAALIAIDLLTAHAALNPTIDPAVYRASTQAAAAIRADGDGRVFMFDADDEAVRQQFGIHLPFADFGPADADRWLQFRETLIANTSMIDGLPSASNFDSLLVGGALQLRDAINRLPLRDALRVLSLMSVRYIASPRALDLPVVYRGEYATIYRNAAALPRVWLVTSARVEADPLAAVLDPSFDPRREAILEAGAPIDSTTDAQFTLHSLQDTPNTVTIRAASDQDGYLLLADTWYPGWQATIDDRPAAVLRANVAFRAVTFPAGEHVVKFFYAPVSLQIGAGLTAMSALLLAAGFAATVRRR